MIIEGLLTTDDAGAPHLAPMGAVVDAELSTWTLRPFQTSKTFQLLQSNPVCVFHVVDDVLPIVRLILDQPDSTPCEPGPNQSWIVPSACHWYQLRATAFDVSDVRSEIDAVVEATGILRPFWGWNRAKHAVLEAAILMTRYHLLGHSTIESEFSRLEPAVVKTAGHRELEAWQMLVENLHSRQSSRI